MTSTPETVNKIRGVSWCTLPPSATAEGRWLRPPAVRLQISRNCADAKDCSAASLWLCKHTVFLSVPRLKPYQHRHSTQTPTYHDAALPTINLNIFTKTLLSERDQNFVKMLALKIKLSRNSQPWFERDERTQPGKLRNSKLFCRPNIHPHGFPSSIPLSCPATHRNVFN
jgi:hypothetical protein